MGKKKITVYLASPYTIGDAAVNVKNQIDAQHKLMLYGFVPFSPLTNSHFHNMVHPKGYDEWMEQDLVWVKKCDCLLRLPGESKGADVEVAYASENNKPVFFNMDDLFRYF